MQVSSRNSQNLEEQMGKFSAWFIGEHILSGVININGIVKSDNIFRKLSIKLDREGKTIEKLIPKIKEIREIFRNIDKDEEKFTKIDNYVQNI